jgi:transcription antitermination factor NusG
LTDWHLVRAARSRDLERVTKSLSRLLPSVVCLYRIEHQVKVPLFQTPYLFAAWATADAAAWHTVRWTAGVAEIVGGATPAIISEVEVASWRALADLDGVVDQQTLLEQRFTVGDCIEFSYGSFEERPGEFIGFRGNSAGIKIPFMGRQTIVYVPVNLVRRVEDAAKQTFTRDESRSRQMRRNTRKWQRVGALQEAAA